MVTIPECEGLFEPLLRILEDKMAPGDDQVDAYLRLTDRLRQEEDVFVSELLKFLGRLVVLFKRDIQSDKSDLCQASLQALGHCLYQQQIASSISFTDGKDLVEGLLTRIIASEDKGICTRALWCLAKQNLDIVVINNQLESILLSLESVMTKDLQSVTVDHEALSVIERLLQQVSKSDLIKTADSWSKLVFPMLVSSAAKVRERALFVMSTGLEHMISSQEKVVKILLPLLKGCFLKEFSNLCSEKKELFVLKCWCCIVPILGETLHKGGSLINDLLKLVEQGFRDQSIEVQVMSFTAWNILIDNFALSSDVLCSQRRVKLIMTPLKNLAVKERNEAVETARLSTWWHFVCLLGPRVQELFEQVCTPLLQFIFGTAIDQISLLKTKEGFSDLKCPPTPTSSKLMIDMMAETPKSSIRRSLRDVGTPRTPTILNASFAKTVKQKLLAQGCEIVLEFLMFDDEEINGNPVVITSLAERLSAVIFKKPDDFKKHACLIMSAVREGFKALGKDMSEPLGVKIWYLLVTRTSKLLQKGSSSDFSEIFLPLLAVMQDLVDSDVLSPTLTLKMLNDLSGLPAEVLSHNMAALHSKDNPQGSPALLLLQLLFTSPLLENIWDSERLHLTFEHFISSGMTTTSGQLFFLKTVLALLEKASSSFHEKDVLWRLWIFVVDQLIMHIQKTNDVNQGDALEHDFSTLYLALQFPIERLDAGLSQGLGKEASKAVAELYRSFSRAAALVPTAETNVCCEELCGNILVTSADWTSKDIAFVDGLVNLAGVMIECLDFTIPSLFSMATTAAGKSPNASPTKWNRRLHKPMGNFTSLVHLIDKLLLACARSSESKESTQTLGVWTATVTSLIDKLSYFFVHINGAATITAVLKTLAPALKSYLESAHTSVKIGQTTLDKRLFTTRLIQKIEKLWMDLLTCVQSRHGGPYDSELLAVMSPLLEVTLGHPKRNIKNHSVMFWNATFAKTQRLTYPEKLRPVLQIAKDKMSLTLPGWENVQISGKESQIDLESEDLTHQEEIVKPLPYGILTSPKRNKPISVPGGSPQMKGSFLHRAVVAEKAIENSSPKMFGRSPKLGRPRNSPAGTHVRRKLPLSKYDDDEKDYVTIAPSPKKKRLLTEHQKDVMRSRSAVPVLYNELDRSQDCSQFSQFTIASQAQITPDSTPSSTPDEEKDQRIENKSTYEIDTTKMEKCEIDSISDDLDADEEETGNQRVDCFGGDKAEDVKIMETEVEEQSSVLRGRNVSMSSSESSGNSHDRDIEDAINTENEPSTGDEEIEAASPDIIPSSQTSSFESPFQCLRQVSVPLSSILPSSFDSLSKKENDEKRELEKQLQETKVTSKDKVIETFEESSETGVADKCESQVKKEEPAAYLRKTIVSPVAGRTRRKLQRKTELEKTLSQTESEDEPTKQEIIQLVPDSDDDSDDNKLLTQRLQDFHETQPPLQSPEKAAEAKIAGLSRDATSSPVPSVMNKFLRPLSAGGSPCRVTLRGTHSPGVSPTTGILKRWPGNKQSVDSPSPPNKIRRVSFALPVKDNICKDTEKNSSEAGNSTLQVKTSNSSPFTAVKQRRSLPASGDLSSCQPGGCMFPELVSCTVPVEQILPSILTMSWSRGMGHLVRAQNIHTIGNLSALREDQVNNLPIKSPKVLTLKRALRRFHQTQKGKNSKALVKAPVKVSFKEAHEMKEDSIFPEHPQLQNEVVEEEAEREAVRGNIEFPVIGNFVPDQAKSDDQLKSCEPEFEVDSDERMSREPERDADLQNENTATPASFDKGERDSSSEVEATDKGEALTPPLPVNDTDANELIGDGLTPRRDTCSWPTRLFTSGEETTSCIETEEILLPDENKESDEKNLETELCDKETNINGLKGLPAQSIAYESVGPNKVESVTDGDKTEREKFCYCLRSLKEFASPEVLRELSTEEIFEAHQNLTEVMSIVVQALRGHCR